MVLSSAVTTGEEQEKVVQRSADETRAWLLGSAVAGLKLLASLAEGDELADVRSSFLGVASAWGCAQRLELQPPLVPKGP